MKTKRTMTLRSIDPRELTRVRGAVGMLLPAVQKIRDAAAPLAAGAIYMKYEGISGDATE